MDNISRYVSSFDQSFLNSAEIRSKSRRKRTMSVILQVHLLYEIICSFANFLRRNYHAGVTIKVDHCNVLSTKPLLWFHTDHGHVLYKLLYHFNVTVYSNVHVYVHISTPRYNAALYRILRHFNNPLTVEMATIMV